MVKSIKLGYYDIYQGTKVVLLSDRFCYKFEVGKLKFIDVDDEVVLFETIDSGISSTSLGVGAKKYEFVNIVYRYLLERYGE